MITSKERPPIGISFWVQWILASVVALVIASVGGVIGGSLVWLLGILIGWVFGIPVVGIMQWLVLRRHVSRISMGAIWVLAYSVGLGFFFGFAVSSNASEAPVWTLGAALGGAIAGGMQWLVLRRISRAGWWVLASSLAWAAGWGVSFELFDVYDPFTIFILGGAVVAAITGAVLVWLLRQPVPEA